MPINEILAPSYLRIKYQTWASIHSLTIYLNGFISQNPDPNAVNQLLLTTPIAPMDMTIEDKVKQIFERAYNRGGSKCPTIMSIEGWNSVPGGNNTFVGNGNPPSLVGSFNTNGVASGYIQWRFRTVDGTSPRQQIQMTFFEALQNAAPQREIVGAIPTTDDQSLSYYVSKAKWITSQDGYAVTTASTINYGYNRKLAKSYGKVLTP